MAKTLVAYVSKSGATEEASKTIAEVLRNNHNLEVDLINLKKAKPNLAQYQNVVLGAGVRFGKVYSEAPKFLKQDLGNRKVAVFLCCGDGGEPARHDGACDKYLGDFLVSTPNVKPIAMEAFGGRAKILGKRLFDTVDSAKTRAWAETIGKEFEK
jgi:menaquinone-dependent protoporphyrinogen IX oxidase